VNFSTYEFPDFEISELDCKARSGGRTRHEPNLHLGWHRKVRQADHLPRLWARLILHTK